MHPKRFPNLGGFTPGLRIFTPTGHRTILWLMASLGLILAGTAWGETEQPRISGGLFLDAQGVPSAMSPPMGRGRVVRIHRKILPTATSGAGARVPFNLFPDVSLEGQVDWSVVRGPASYSCGGPLVGTDGGHFILSVEEDAVCGKIHSANHGTFVLRGRRDGLGEIVQADLALLPLDEEDTVEDGPGRTGWERALGIAAREEGGDPAIDVMVVYTPSACAGVGGTTAMRALIHLIIDETNQMFTNSLIPAHVALVHAQELTYDEHQNPGTDLARLSNPNDGYMDEVAGYREIYGADLVCLIPDGLSGGMSQLPGRFFIVHYTYATLAYTFTHEMGHNFGCRHEGGHYFFGTGGGEYRTVMKYPPGTVLMHFSNPDVSWDGVPTGTATNDNAHVVGAAAAEVAATQPHRTLYVSPYDAFAPAGGRGGPFAPTGTVYTLVNPTASDLAWTARGEANWLSVSPAGGTLPAAGTSTVSAIVNANAGSLPPGAHSSSIIFSNSTDGSVQSRPVALTVFAAGSVPFVEDFETGVWSNYWRITGTGPCRADIIGGLNRAPVSGTNNLHMDSKAAFGPARNEVTLNLDLKGCSNIVLRFWAKGPLESYTAPPGTIFSGGADFDGVALSTNGTIWYAFMALRNLGNDFAEFSTNLDQVITRHGLKYTSSFRIRFNQYGDRTRSDYGGTTIDYITVTGDAPAAATLSLPPQIVENQGVLTHAGTIVRTGDVASNAWIALRCSLPSLIEVPPEVEIPAGQTSATFSVTVVDDQILNRSRTAYVTASNAALKSGEAYVEVLDDDSTTLAVDLPGRGTEGSDETPSGTVSIPVAAGVDVPILLTSSAPAELTVPTSVVLPAGQTSTVFSLTIVDDLRIDGVQTITVWAAAANWIGGSDAIEIEDNEHTDLILSVPALAVEGNGVLSNAGRVAISGTLPAALPVALSSLDPSEVMVPADVVISAGATSALFHVTIVDDGDMDGRQTNQITAAATGFAPANASIVVADNDDLHHFAWGSVSNATRGGAFDVRIEARHAADGRIDVFTGTVALSCSNSTGPLAILPTATTAFAAGVWTGRVIVLTVGSNATLQARHGGGTTGASAAFDVVGPVAHISWGALTNLPVPIGAPSVRFVTVSNSGNCDLMFTAPDPLALPTNGLVLHYGFDSNEVEIVTDLSGMGNTGRVVGASFTSTGRTGNAYSFDGTSSIVASNSLSLIPSNLTLSVWVRPSIDMAGSTIYNIVNKYNDAMDRGFRLLRNYAIVIPGKGISFEASCLQVARNQDFLTDRWYHLAACYSQRIGDGVPLFINGSWVANGSKSCSLTYDATPLSVGSSWRGIIDEVRLYKRALEPYEVALLSEEGSGRQWLSMALGGGTLPPGASTSLVVTLDATGFAAGERRETVARILGNDLVSPASTSRVEMLVLPATPVLDAEPPFSLGDTNGVSWSLDTHTHFYWAESALATNADALTNSGWLSTNAFIFANLSNQTRYFYRVKASSSNANGQTEGAWSDWVHSLQLTPPGDPDGDGMPNWWEVAHELDPTNPADAFDDPDHDTHPNWQEWGADTDPSDRTDFFRVSVMDTLEARRCFFDCSPGRTYSLQGNTNLAEGIWHEVAGQTNVPGESGRTMHLDDTNASAGRFYRVKVNLP